MSAGHGAHGNVPALDDEFYHRVTLLVDACRIDRNHTIPWLANRSVDGRVVYIDEIVPQVLPNTQINTDLTLPYHELAEWLGMNEGEVYDDAHASKGNAAEKRRVEELGGDWDAYQAEMADYIRAVDHEGMTNVPADIDQRVFIDDDDRAALEAIIADNPKGSHAMTVKHKAFGMMAENLADKRQVIVNCSEESPDRVGDIVVQKGIDFSAFMKIGGTILWQHKADEPIAKAIEMQIVDGVLRATAQFPEAGVSAKADEIYGLIKGGVVNAASIGFAPVDYEPIDAKEPYGAQRFTKVELMEFSFVSVPCARGATVVARSMDKTKNAEITKDQSWKVGASRNLPIDEDSSWDGPAAEKSVFDHTGFDGDSPNTSLARKAFLVYDAKNPKLKGSYKLPFAKMVNGRMTAVASGIRAAASRLSQTDIPDDVAKNARAVIDHYEAKMGKRSIDDIVATIAKMTPDEVNELFEKAGRAISGANAEHVKAIRGCLKGMQDCSDAIAAQHKAMNDFHTKAHDFLHDTVLSMQDHGTSLGDHLKSLEKAAKKPKPDQEDTNDDDQSDDDNTDNDQELSAEVEARKRLTEVMERASA